ncbi:MAG: CpsD/CapB family tyrosine-protein kinase [Acidobacteriota bacterium]|nr:CpsD/CapB family tyrosine-protein kinase [Acidobacteriota bacterium]MDH3528204.1 CpsD/CapB family tyrosine-protein kinase [Acidobacteriota bacterium]
MSILKALEKRKTENPGGESRNGGETRVDDRNVVPFDKNTRARRSTPPRVFVEEDFRIGTPRSASSEQSDSTIGTALPDLKTSNTAGATLDTVGSPRSVRKPLPEFARWEVEAERVEPRLVSITQPHSTYCEEYRTLRTHVLHKSQRRKLQSIVVGSVNPAEGKTITSLNLAWLLAQTDGVKALIIDSDLRMPSLTDYLGIETDKGLSDILSGTCSVEETIVRLEPSGLHLLPGGEARNDVAELLSGPRFQEILREAREMFDYVIIDAPPLGVFTDATVLINQADGAILVVRAGRTKYSAVDRILETLPSDRMLGVILNQSEEVLNESTYGYGYYGKRYKREESIE